MHYNIVISLGKRQFCVTLRHIRFKLQYRVTPPRAWITASTVHIIHAISHRMWCWCNAASNWRKFCIWGSTACTWRPSVFQIYSVGLKFGLIAGYGEKWRLHFEGRRLLPLHDAAWYCHPKTQVLQLVSGCRNGEQQLALRHLWYTDHLLGFLVWWPSPTCNHEKYTLISLVRLQRKGELAECYLSPNSHSCIGYMKQKPALVRPMDPTPGPQIQTTSR
jgi:hypothetical protein